MIIKVKGYLTYRDVIGKLEFEQHDDPPISLLEFVQILAEKIGGEHGDALFDAEHQTIGPSVVIMLNGLHSNHLPDRLNTILKDQDEIAVFPPGAGG